MELLQPLVGIGSKYIYKSQGFGEHGYDYSQFGMIGHNGIDWRAGEGVPIYAMRDGWIVEATKKDSGYGLRITEYFEADGFGWDITYGHMSKINYPDIGKPNVEYDRHLRKYPVKRGQVIGYVGHSGTATGNHLHVTLRKFKDGQILNYSNGYKGAIDPAPYITIKNTGEVMNDLVKIINYKGTVFVALGADSPDHLIYLGKLYGRDINVDPATGTIESDITIA